MHLDCMSASASHIWIWWIDLGCDEAASVFIREEACCILQDMRTEALGANGKNSITAAAVAADGAEKSTMYVSIYYLFLFRVFEKHPV